MIVVRNRPRSITHVAVAAGLGVVLSYAKLYTLPQGGSVALASLPILLVALRSGPLTGVAAGSLLGLLKILLGAHIFHPVQFLLDYPVAFAALGMAGLLRGYPSWGILLGGLGRGVCHVVSGVVFFGSYAPVGTGVWRYSLGYNASYLLPELVIALLVLPAISRRLETQR